MGLNAYSDYGSGSSINSSQSWGSQELDTWNSIQVRKNDQSRQKATSILDMMLGKCTLKDVMQEFRMNGSDSPYNPDEELWSHKPECLSGMGPASVYMRQKSWPAPERSPAPRLLRPPPPPHTSPWTTEEVTPAPLLERVPDFSPPLSPVMQADSITEEQRRVLSTLSDTVVYSLLREMEQARLQGRRKKRLPDECRFCKNNGERESYYRSHVLKDALGRVRCPVLRAFVCARCGARGDHAHTIKYCPLSTAEERVKSAAMMRSVRLASGKRRNSKSSSTLTADDYVNFGETPTSVIEDNTIYNLYGETPLDPIWAALEQKLLL